MRLRSLAGLSVVIQSSALWLSGSRSGSAIVLVEVGVFVGLALYVRTSAVSARWIKIGLALFVIGSLPALTPLLSRLAHAAPQKAGHTEPGAGVVSADAQVNSNEFRRWTWIGTAHMAQSNPVLGTGFGAFDLSYARYEETAFTTQAHNSYLQLMAETGYLGVLLVLMGLAAAAAFAAHSLMMQRRRALEAAHDAAGGQAAEPLYHPLIQSPELLLAGLLAAVVGSMLHSLTDSDWYVAANAFTLAAVIALVVALVRDLAPLSTRRPGPLRREIIALGAVLAVLLLWRGAQLASSRMSESLGTTDLDIASSNDVTQETKSTNLTQAADAFRAAAAADPLDPEPHLGLAETAVTPNERLQELNAAIAVCRTGKAYYRLGQYYVQQSEWVPAIEAFEHARDLEPKMPQTLRALAQAYLAVGKTNDAERTLQRIAALQLTPFGQVRAMHESVETEFAYAHSMLGDMYAKRGDWQGAAQQYEQARDVLSEYWIGRHFLINIQLRTDVKRNELADLFETVLKQLETSYTKLNQPTDAQAAEARLQTVRNERAADAAASANSPTGSSSSK
jgi:tetratricopeptide (TPR) repeat protein